MNNCQAKKQANKIKKELIALNKLITTTDRKKIMEEKNYKKQFLANYMNGRAANLDTATEIIVFMRNRIKQREIQLAQTA